MQDVNSLYPTAAGWRWLLAAVVALGLLGGSVALNPRVFVFEVSPEKIPEDTTAPVFLYEADGTKFYFTSSNLLYPPETDDGETWDALVFPVWPDEEWSTAKNAHLPWYRNLTAAMRGRTDSKAPTGDEFVPNAADEQDVQELHRLRDSAPLPRGDVELIRISPESEFFRHTGIKVVGALSTRVPMPRLYLSRTTRGEKRPTGPRACPADLRGADVGAQAALATALERAVALDAKRIGIPFLYLPERLGYSATPAESWKRVLNYARTAAKDSGIEAVYLGGWSRGNRRLREQAFRDAWSSVRAQLDTDKYELQDPALRASLLVGVVLFLTAYRRRPFSLNLLAAFVLGAGAVPAGVEGTLAWLEPLWRGRVSRWLWLWLYLLALVAAGLALRWLAGIDWKKEIQRP